LNDEYNFYPGCASSQLASIGIASFLSIDTSWAQFLALSEAIATESSSIRIRLRKYAYQVMGERDKNMAASLPASLVVHVRRGDYLGTGYDVLRASYFQNAYRQMIESQCISVQSKVIIVSDSMDQALSLLSSNIPQVEPVQSDDPLVALYFLAAARARILSNSTLSMCGSALSANPSMSTFPLFGSVDNSWNQCILKKMSWILVPTE
jgi:hypothetical protein